MSTNKFIEIVKFSKSLLFLVIIQLIIFLIYIFNKKEGDFSIYIIFFTIISLAILTKLKIEIDKYSIRYKLFPFHLFYKKIDLAEIEEINLINLNALNDFWGWGFRYSSKYGWSYVLDGNYGLFLKLKTGKKLTFTINNKEELTKFFEKNNISFKTC